jgi:hypothetical protein
MSIVWVEEYARVEKRVKAGIKESLLYGQNSSALKMERHVAPDVG